MERSTGDKALQRRHAILNQHFPGWEKEVWTWQQQPGWTWVPRTLGLIANLTKLLAEKEVDPSQIYQELWFRIFPPGGLVEVRGYEEEFARSCGCTVRTWRKAVAKLEQFRFIKAVKKDGRYLYLFVRKPDLVMEELEEAGKIPEQWLKDYDQRLCEIGVKSYASLVAK